MLNNPLQRPAQNAEVLSVSQLNQRARHLLEDVFARIRVEGEISNLARPASGHLYFTLKDEQAQVRCALFRQQAIRVRQFLENGALVRVSAKVSLYEGRGDYQLIVDSLEPAGDGALRAAFDALKNTLLQQGLFAQEQKQKLPVFPRKIAVITSPTGAVIQDIISVFRRRAPHVSLTLIPTAVQGRDATAQIIQAIKRADRACFDAIILARGGGSLEDLWCFNEETVAHAIFNCKTPIISAIGHETDVSISDFVADVRAPTPSAAAELLAPDQQALLQKLTTARQRLSHCLKEQLARKQLQLNGLRQAMRHPKERIEQSMQRLDDLELRLARTITKQQQNQQQQLNWLRVQLGKQHPRLHMARQQQTLAQNRDALIKAMNFFYQRQQQQLHHQAQSLHLVSPLATLDRGYSILHDAHLGVIRDAAHVQSGQQLQARLAKGTLVVKVVNNTA